MKKIICNILLMIFVFLPTSIFAAGYISVSPGSLTIEQGSSKTFTITAYNAIGDVTISSGNTSIASVSSSYWDTGIIDSGQTKVGNITVNGINIGTTTIILNIDAATFDSEDLSGQTKMIIVDVVEKPKPAPTPVPTPTPSPQPSTNPSVPTDTRSTNTELDKLSINGKKITNVNNEFVLEVSNYIEKIDITATTKDSKANVSGTGNKNLKVGENSFDIIVTAEKGNKTTYKIKITRKQYNDLNDLDELLKLNKDGIIKINDNDKLTKEQVDKIIDKKNKISLVKMADDNKSVLYTFVLDGEQIESVQEFNPNILMTILDDEAVGEALNYADGIYFDFSSCVDIPLGVSLKYYVGDKYKENDKVKLYSYSDDKIILLKENIIIKDGYVEFTLNDSVKYFVSKANLLGSEHKDFNIWFIVSMILIFIIILYILIRLFTKLIKKKKKSVNDIEVLSFE